MAAPAIYNIQVVEGDTLRFNLQFKDAGTNTPANMTGATVKMQVRESFDAATTLADYQLGTGFTWTDAANGMLVLSRDVTFGDGEYVYDLQITKDGVVSTWMGGQFKVLPGVSA